MEPEEYKLQIYEVNILRSSISTRVIRLIVAKDILRRCADFGTMAPDHYSIPTPLLLTFNAPSVLSALTY